MQNRYEKEKFIENLKILCNTFGVKIVVEESGLVFQFQDGDKIPSDQEFDPKKFSNILQNFS